MKLEDLSLWEFDSEPNENNLIQCPECKEWSSVDDWIESEVGCEDCGSHSAMMCPECEERFDHVWGPTFKTK